MSATSKVELVQERERQAGLVRRLLLHLWPAPGTTVLPRWSSNQPSITDAGVMRPTGSAPPVMNAEGTVTLAPSSWGGMSQLWSKFRYQFRPPVNPVRENSPM